MKKRLKMLTTATLASALMIGGMGISDGQAEAADAKVVRDVNFRTGPSLSASKIRLLDAGETVDIISKVNSYWYKVEDENGRTGYVSALSKYIQPLGTSATSVRNEIISTGKEYLGTPYVFGSNRSTTTSFDCSDFVRHVYKTAAGITLPTNSRTQAAYFKENGTTTTNWEDLEPGDVIFFMSYEGTAKSNYTGIDKSKETITHNAIYLGDGKILHTYSQASGGVRIDTLEGKHWEYRIVFGGSIL